MDLASVQDDALDGRLVGDRRIVDDGLELPAREVLDAARRPAQSQHRLRGEDDERPARTRIGLASQQVEVGGGRRRAGHGHVVLGTQLEVALDARGGVIRPLALIAVRQEQDHARALSPLLLGARDELVDDGLGAVREVAELRLPEDESIGPFDGVPILEPDCGVLAQERVVDPELRLLVAQVREGQPLLAVLAVVEHRVPLHERAAAGVLPGHPHGGALEQQRAEGEEFPEGPVDRSVAAHLDALAQERLQLRVHREVGGRVVERIADLLDDRRRDAGGRRFSRPVVLLGVRTLKAGDGPLVLDDDRDRRGLGGVRLGERALEPVLEVGVGALVLFLGDVAAADERIGVQGADGSLCLNEVVHQGLGHRGVVSLVVPAAAVADEVDHDIAVELLAIVERELGDPHDGLGVVPVDVHDGRLDGLGDVGRVDRRAALAGRGREPDLVVDDEVDGSARAVPAQLGHLQDLDDDALTGHRGVAVDHDREHIEGAHWSAVLLGAHDPLEHAVDGLEVGRVRGEVHGDLVPGRPGEGALRSEVVLHVAGPLDGAGILGALELPEYLPVCLPGDVREHVEAASVGHPDGGLLEL